MDYNKLRTFVTVSREGSVTRAAYVVGRTQSAVTQQIATLEDEIGMKLFERRKNQLFLTHEGRALLETAEHSFLKLDSALGHLRGDEGLTTEIVRIGVSQDIAEHLLSDRLCAFRKSQPNSVFELILGDDAQLELSLSQDELDLALIIRFRDRKFFEVSEAFRIEERPFSTRVYAKSKPMRKPADLLERDLFDFSQNFACWNVWFRKNAPSLVAELNKRRPCVCAKSHETLKSLLPMGGVALLPTHIAEREGKASALIPVFPDLRPIKVGVDIARRRRGNVSPMQESLWRFLTVGQVK